MMESRLNIDPNDYLFLPLTTHLSEKISPKFGLLEQKVFPVRVEVLVHPDQVAIFTKIKNGLVDCKSLLLTGLGFTILYGVLIWFIEQWKNKEFSSRPKDVFTGIWLGMVTMTTVGYGDITPKSVAGRILTMGLMLASILLSAILSNAGLPGFTAQQ